MQRKDGITLLIFNKFVCLLYAVTALLWKPIASAAGFTIGYGYWYGYSIGIDDTVR
jgi:hypothetical protein